MNILVDEQDGRTLARFARRSIEQALGGRVAERPNSASLEQLGATFVTLHKDGELHGCIGALEPSRTILDDVAYNAVAAALFDPRAPRLALEEVPLLEVEVSLLSPLSPIEYDGTEEGACAALVPFRDGVVLRWGDRRGTFLPQVWESLPRPQDFMRQLKQKAGLPSDFWSPAIRLYRYTSRKWNDRQREQSES